MTTSSLDFKKIYTILADENEYPKWFTKGRDGIFSVSLSNRKGDTSRFDCHHMKVGKDENFQFYLEEVGITEPFRQDPVIFPLFMIVLVFTCEPKNKNFSPDAYIKKFMLDFEILPPVYQ